MNFKFHRPECFWSVKYKVHDLRLIMLVLLGPKTDDVETKDYQRRHGTLGGVRKPKKT